MLSNLINESKFKALMKSSAKKGVIMAGRTNVTGDDVFYFTDRHFMVKLPVFPNYLFELFGSIPNRGEEISVSSGHSETKFNDSMHHLFRTTQENAKYGAYRLSLRVDLEDNKKVKSGRLLSVDGNLVIVDTELDAMIPAIQHNNLRGSGILSPITWANGVILPMRAMGKKEKIIAELGFLFPNKKLEAVR